MKAFTPVYIPAGVGTFHMETADAAFRSSREMLADIDGRFVCPENKLLSVEDLAAFLDSTDPDFIVFQNLTFANGAYMSELLRRFNDRPVLLWTLREPISDGGRLKLNSLTGAFSAANVLHSFGHKGFEYVLGAPGEDETRESIKAACRAAELAHDMKSLKLAAVGHTPQGFGFGRALDTELTRVFGAELVSAEAREIMDKARSYTDGDCTEYLERTAAICKGFEATPEENRIAHAKLYRAYTEFIRDNGIGALASRCWPDFFTAYGTPVCAVLSLLNDDGIASACEADVYGALSMWAGMRLSSGPVFFGDPVSLCEQDGTITFWHCGAAACSLARRDTGARVGVHPNRKIGPAMDFGCEACDGATVFRIGRLPDGGFRFFIEEGTIPDMPKQYTGTSVVVKTDRSARDIVEEGVRAGWEPHFAVIRGRHGRELRALASFLGISCDR